MVNRTAFTLLMILALIPSAAAQSSGADQDRRRAYLEELLTIIQPEHPERGGVTRLDPTWRDWLARTGELPPDFDQLPSLPFLPDPLVLDEGGGNIPVTTARQWQAKREWIKGQVKHWITGTFPPAPDNLTAEVLSETTDGRVTFRMVELRFGPQQRARLAVELMIPALKGPLPVFMTQWNHRDWAMVAVRRGYIGCIYAGADIKDDTEAFAEIWCPEYDFTRLMRRAWGAHRVVDYLYTLPIVDREKIALTGHSRNGKQSLMAAAFDERIKAVISGSGLTGAGDPYRYTADKFDNESIAEITTNFPYWLHPRLRFFIGREHKLPVDQNLLMALIAPRGIMFSSAVTEDQGNPWGVEQNYLSLRRVYEFLGAERNLAISLRPGQHAYAARDLEQFVDFFDYVFGRGNIEPPRKLFYNYTFDRWRELSGENIDPQGFPELDPVGLLKDGKGKSIVSRPAWEQKKKDISRRINWALGEEPPGAGTPGPREFSRQNIYSEDFLGQVIGRPQADRTMGLMNLGGASHSFGDCLYYNLYFPLDGDGKMKPGPLPAVIFLHEYAYPTGFARRIEPFLKNMIGLGYAVLAFDLVGFGTRIEEGTLFYERYPHWSKMGNMAADVRSAVNLLQELDFIDKARIYAVGYSLGATVGLFSAALDERIAGAASVCGFTPLRTATPDKGLEGVRAFSHLHGLIPRLGFFTGSERRIPFDFHEVLASIAPRPLLVVAPTLDRDACFADVQTCVDEAGKVYRLLGKENNLSFSGPKDYNHFPGSRQQEVLDWLAAR